MEQQTGGIARDFLSPQERTRLLGLCRTLTGNYDAAEDLVQETLLLAWRHMESLRDPTKRTRWIAGIARNISLRWLRQHGRDRAHSDGQETASLEDLADECDLEVELERRELAELLDRALLLLPAETRDLLLKRYIDESPLAEIAIQLGINASAVAMRLQRGKLALRKVLVHELGDALAAYKPGASSETWDTTSLWCNLCGTHHLLGRRQPERGMLYLKCPACSPGDAVLSKNEAIPALMGITSYRPAYMRLGEWCNAYYRTGLRDGQTACLTCQRLAPVNISPAEDIRELLWLNRERPRWAWAPGDRLVNVICPHCQSVSCITLEGLVLSLPEGRAFLRAQRRIHFLPYRSIEFAGRPAIVTSFASRATSALLEVICDERTYTVLQVRGVAHA